MSSGQEVGAIFGDGTGPAAALLRSPTVIIASIALWGMNVCLFRLFGIDYAYVLQLDLKKDEEEQIRRRMMKQTGRSSNNAEPSADESVDNSESEIGSDKEEKQKTTGGGEIEMNSLAIMTSIDDEDSHNDNLVNVSLVSDVSPSSKEAKSFMSSNSSNREINEVKLIGLAATLIATLYLTSYFWIQVGRGTTIGAIFCFYTLVIVGIMAPLPSTAWIRYACKIVFVRAGALLKPRCSCVHGRPKPVPFIDVFFADGMCSMSKVFFDWGMLWLLASHYPHPVPPSLQSIIVPSCFASLPYLIRARQCLIMYNVGKHKNDPKRYQHVLNAIKYSTSLFPLIVSAFQKTTYGQNVAEKAEVLLIVLLAINATYCLTWDIVMDWGMMQDPNAVMEQTVGQFIPLGRLYGVVPNSDGHPSDPKRQTRNCLDTTLRPRLRFGTSLTLIIVFLDTFLRFSWTLRFCVSVIFPSNDAYILCTEFLEVFRRSVWNLLRVEWEHIKQTRQSRKDIVVADLSIDTGTPEKTLMDDTMQKKTSPQNALGRSSTSRERKSMTFHE